MGGKRKPGFQLNITAAAENDGILDYQNALLFLILRDTLESFGVLESADLIHFLTVWNMKNFNPCLAHEFTNDRFHTSHLYFTKLTSNVPVFQVYPQPRIQKVAKKSSQTPSEIVGGGYTFQNLTAAHWPPQNLLVGTIWWWFTQKTIPLRSNLGSLLAKSNFPLFVFFWLFGNILDIVQNHDLGPKICKIELWSKKQSWRA